MSKLLLVLGLNSSCRRVGIAPGFIPLQHMEGGDPRAQDQGRKSGLGDSRKSPTDYRHGVFEMKIVRRQEAEESDGKSQGRQEDFPALRECEQKEQRYDPRGPDRSGVEEVEHIARDRACMLEIETPRLAVEMVSDRQSGEAH